MLCRRQCSLASVSGQRAAVIEGVRLRSYFSSQGQELGTSVVMQQKHILECASTPSTRHMPRRRLPARCTFEHLTHLSCYLSCCCVTNVTTNHPENFLTSRRHKPCECPQFTRPCSSRGISCIIQSRLLYPHSFELQTTQDSLASYRRRSVLSE